MFLTILFWDRLVCLQIFVVIFEQIVPHGASQSSPRIECILLVFLLQNVRIMVLSASTLHQQEVGSESENNTG